MPFGLCNAPATFQRLMQEIFKKQLYKSVLCYLDDILIFSKSFDEHLERLEEVLKLLKENGLKLKRDKCSFGKKEVGYLGHVVSKDGNATDPKKTETVSKWKKP